VCYRSQEAYEEKLKMVMAGDKVKQGTLINIITKHNVYRSQERRKKVLSQSKKQKEDSLGFTHLTDYALLCLYMPHQVKMHCLTGD
jgi:hypothetical protein